MLNLSVHEVSVGEKHIPNQLTKFSHSLRVFLVTRINILILFFSDPVTCTWIHLVYVTFVRSHLQGWHGLPFFDPSHYRISREYYECQNLFSYRQHTGYSHMVATLLFCFKQKHLLPRISNIFQRHFTLLYFRLIYGDSVAPSPVICYSVVLFLHYVEN